MVIQVFSIYVSVLETDIVTDRRLMHQEKGNFNNEDSDVSPNVSTKKT